MVPAEQGPGINDARQIDQKVLTDFAAYLRDLVRRGDLAMAALRSDQGKCQVLARRFKEEGSIYIP